jgi:hypothetical protein
MAEITRVSRICTKVASKTNTDDKRKQQQEIDDTMSAAYHRRLVMADGDYQDYVDGDSANGADKFVATLAGREFQSGLARYIPQRKATDEELERGVASLDAALEKLPDIPQVSAENSQLRAALVRTRIELGSLEAERGIWHQASQGTIENQGLKQFRNDMTSIRGLFDDYLHIVTGPGAPAPADVAARIELVINRTIERLPSAVA